MPDQDTQVFFGNTLVEIYTLIEERRKTDPKNTKLLWHKMIQKPTTARPGGFALEPQGNVWFTLPQHLTFQAGGVKDEAGDRQCALDPRYRRRSHRVRRVGQGLPCEAGLDGQVASSRSATRPPTDSCAPWAFQFCPSRL